MRLSILLLILLPIVSACAGPQAPSNPATKTSATVFGATSVTIPTATAVVARPSPTTIPTAPGPAPTVALSGPTAEVLAKVAVSRGLAVKRDVVADALSRDDLRAELIKSAEQDGIKEDIEKAKALLVALELLDPSEDLYQLWLEALAEQIAGYYDSETHEMKLIKSGSLATMSTSDELVLAHEYTHALQDQHYDLSLMFDRVKKRGEATTALQALTEGDATLSMAEYARRYKTPEQLAEFYGKPTRMDASKLRAAPAVVQSSLLFPYQQGAAFVAGLYQSGGWSAVNAAYGRPPASTEQILHPDRYQRGDLPRTVALPNIAVALGSQWQQFDNDTVGELGWLQYLAGGGLSVSSGGPTSGWGGDSYVIFRDDVGKLAFASLIVWDAPRNASAFFAAVRDTQKARRGTTLPVLTDHSLAWTGKSASGFVGIDGFNVLLVITPDAVLTKNVVARFPGFES